MGGLNSMHRRGKDLRQELRWQLQACGPRHHQRSIQRLPPRRLQPRHVPPSLAGAAAAQRRAVGKNQ